MYFIPSIYAHIIGGLLVLFAFLFILTVYTNIREPYKVLMVLLMFSIAISVHGLSHLGLEVAYGYNPARTLLGQALKSRGPG